MQVLRVRIAELQICGPLMTLHRWKLKPVKSAPDKPTSGKPTSRASDLFFLAADQNRIVVSVRFCVEEKTPMLRTMMVDPSARRLRVGTSLLCDFSAYLDVNAIRDVLRLPYAYLVSFYAQIGFETVAENKIPLVLQERLAGYRSRNSDKSYIAMKRAGNQQ